MILKALYRPASCLAVVMAVGACETTSDFSAGSFSENAPPTGPAPAAVLMPAPEIGLQPHLSALGFESTSPTLRMADGLSLCSAVYGLAANVDAGTLFGANVAASARRYGEMAVAAHVIGGLTYPNATWRVDMVEQTYLDDMLTRNAAGGDAAVDPYTAELLGFCGPLEQRFLASLN